MDLHIDNNVEFPKSIMHSVKDKSNIIKLTIDNFVYMPRNTVHTILDKSEYNRID